MKPNRLFVVLKPGGISCNKFLSQIKKKYGVKKAGYSGTLDPFASGVLIVAFGQYSKLFRFLNKTPKRYEAVLWLGAKSQTLDIEGVEFVNTIEPIAIEKLYEAADRLKGTLTYAPPKFSAKKINGKRAYDLARSGKDVKLKEITTEVFNIAIKEYNHPFITFEVCVSEGGYIRSIGKMMADFLGFDGCLKELKRVDEGAFFYEDEKALNPLMFLNLKENFYLGDKEDIALGRVLDKENFRLKQSGEYFVRNGEFLSVIEIGYNVKYLLNRIELC